MGIFFEQSFGYSLLDIKKSKNVVLGKRRFPLFPKNVNHGFDFPPATESEVRCINFYCESYKKYIKCDKPTSKYIQKKYESMLLNKGRILGVICRGTDYFLKPQGHPIQPAPEVVIEKAEKVMLEQKCNYLFLATEDSDFFALFKNKFGEKLLSVEQKCFSINECKDFHRLAELFRGGEGAKAIRTGLFACNQSLVSLSLFYRWYLLCDIGCPFNGE